MIADTSFLIDIMRGDGLAIHKETTMEKDEVQVFLTTVSIFELHVGFNLSTKQIQESEKIERVLGNLIVLPLDFVSAKEAGEIYADKKRRGSPIDPEDAMIAGICRAHGEPILTRNVNHFSGIDGLKVESY